VVAAPSLGVKSIKDLIALAKAQPGKIAKPTGSKLVKGPAESEKFVRWKSMKNSEENS
jgi:hypothetical protein